MPIPANSTSATATVIGSLPFTDSQQVDDAGTTYSVWYKYVADFDGVIGVWGFGDLAVYKPNSFVGSPDDLTTYLGLLLTGTSANKPLCFPVANGQTYYFDFFPTGNPSPANITVSVLKAPTTSFAIGDLFITGDDVTDAVFWATILAGDADNTVRRFDNSNSPGEQGQVLESGKFILSDDGNFTWPPKTNFYDSDLTLLSSLSWADVPFIGLSKVLQTLYVFAPAPTFYTLSEMDGSGALTGTTWVTTVTSVGAITVNSDASILYYSRGGISDIKRWNLTTNTAMTDLVATAANYKITDLIYLEDDTILACFLRSSPVDVVVKRFDTSGTVLNTYNFGIDSQTSGAPPRLATAIDSPNSFWIWIKLTSTKQTSKFYNIKISDGSTLVDRTHVVYQVGVYSGTATATPESRFGSSHSCTFLVLRQSESGPTTGDLTVTKDIVPPDATVFDFIAGGGLAPGTFSLADGGSQAFLGLAPGSGYSVAETPNPAYTTTVVVSNGSPITAISVSAGESVIVAFTNTLVVIPGRPGCPLGYPASVTGRDGCASWSLP